ncbi:MAG: hypothetical protein KatS3mg085_443 [Candidatus Dojkabacteria bacterium]|nr:MAG: hypothetical protein KatS3mg085_443 [Candidatus Dojkabacteria bacterium]
MNKLTEISNRFRDKKLNEVTKKLARKGLASVTGGSSELILKLRNFAKKHKTLSITIGLFAFLLPLLPLCLLLFLPLLYGNLLDLGYRFVKDKLQSIIKDTFLDSIFGATSDLPTFAENIENGRYSCIGDTYLLDTLTGEIVSLYDMSQELQVNLTCLQPLEVYLDLKSQQNIKNRFLDK